MNFELVLETIIGPREYFYDIECNVCGFDEIYFQHPVTKKLIGVACMGCNYVKRFEYQSV